MHEGQGKPCETGYRYQLNQRLPIWPSILENSSRRKLIQDYRSFFKIHLTKLILLISIRLIRSNERWSIRDQKKNAQLQYHNTKWLVSGGDILSAMNEDGGSIPGGVAQGDLPPLVPSKPPSLGETSSLHSNEPAGQTGAGHHGHGCLLLTVSALAADGSC